MKLAGKKLIGRRVDEFSKGWWTVKYHPSNYYRKYDAIQDKLQTIIGTYVELDHGTHVTLRFSDETDMNMFHGVKHDVQEDNNGRLHS